MSEPCVRHRYLPTSHANDVELAARLNELVDAGLLALPLPRDYLVGRGYEMVISTEGTGQDVTVRTYYGGYAHAGAVLRDETWHAEHTLADEIAFGERQVEQWEDYARGTRRRLAGLRAEMAPLPAPLEMT